MKSSVFLSILGSLLLGGCIAAVDPYGNVAVVPAPVTITTPPVYIQPPPPVYVPPPHYQYKQCYSYRQKRYNRYGRWSGGYHTYRRCY